MSRISVLATTFALCLGLALASALPSQAAQAEPSVKNAPTLAKDAKSLRGTVLSTTATGFTLEGPGGRNVIVEVDAETRYEQRGHGSTPLSLTNVTVGMNVTVFGKQSVKAKRKNTTTSAVAGESFIAARVVLPAVRTESAFGTVSAVSSTSITVMRLNGTTLTADITADSRVLPAGTTLAVGDRVGLQARWDATRGTAGSHVATSIRKVTPRAKPPAKPKVTPTPITVTGAS